MSELLDVGIGIFVLLLSLEPVKLLVIEIEVGTVVTFGAVGVFPATDSVFMVVAVMVVGNRSVAVQFAQDEITCNYKSKYACKNYCAYHELSVLQ